MSGQLFNITYLIIVVAYSIGSLVMIYHIFRFGINTKIAIVSTLAYVVGSIFMLTLLFINLRDILAVVN